MGVAAAGRGGDGDGHAYVAAVEDVLLLPLSNSTW